MSRVLGLIIAYGNPDVAKKCLVHVSNQHYKNVDWVLWNNGGADVTSPGVITHNSQNILWTPALNKAIETYLLPEHEFIFYMNHDIYLPPNAIEVLIHILENDPEAGAVGPVGSALGGLQDWVSNTENFRNTNLIRASYIMGAVQMMKREVWDAVGKFDENMPLGADDFDYSIRMKEAGYSLWVTSKIYVDHVGHVTGNAPEWNEYGAAGWKAFEGKYDMYHGTEEEAIKALWNGRWDPDFPLGTGISEEEKIKRGIKNAL